MVLQQRDDGKKRIMANSSSRCVRVTPPLVDPSSLPSSPLLGYQPLDTVERSLDLASPRTAQDPFQSCPAESLSVTGALAEDTVLNGILLESDCALVKGVSLEEGVFDSALGNGIDDDSAQADFIGESWKRRVRWNDFHGQNLVDILEFEASDASYSEDDDDDDSRTCSCTIQ